MCSVEMAFLYAPLSPCPLSHLSPSLPTIFFFWSCDPYTLVTSEARGGASSSRCRSLGLTSRVCCSPVLEWGLCMCVFTKLSRWPHCSQVWVRTTVGLHLGTCPWNHGHSSEGIKRRPSEKNHHDTCFFLLQKHNQTKEWKKKWLDLSFQNSLDGDQHIPGETWGKDLDAPDLGQN